MLAKNGVLEAIDVFGGVGGFRLGLTQAFGDKIKFVWGCELRVVYATPEGSKPATMISAIASRVPGVDPVKSIFIYRIYLMGTIRAGRRSCQTSGHTKGRLITNFWYKGHAYDV